MSSWILLAAVSFAPDAPARPAGSASADLRQAIETLRATDLQGQGSTKAVAAWRTLSRIDVDQLPELLAGMDGANPVARNWLRSAADPIIERARTAKRPLPLASLEAFLSNSRHDPQARRLAYDLIVQQDAKAPERLLPGMLDDPNPDLRYDAVARLTADGDRLLAAKQKAEAVTVYQKCLAFAREKDQIDRLAGKLKELGHPVDLPRQYGFVMDWKLIGPFPNPQQKGVETPYPPEKTIDPSAAYDGGTGKVRWKDFVTTSPAGVVDLNQAVGKAREGIAYALTEFTSDRDRPVEIRMSSINALKLWVNGERVLERFDAYTGIRMDSYIAHARLRRGANRFLIKLCKDEPPELRLDKWWFALRVCDDHGAAVLSTTRPAPPSPEKKS